MAFRKPSVRRRLGNNINVGGVIGIIVAIFAIMMHVLHVHFKFGDNPLDYLALGVFVFVCTVFAGIITGIDFSNYFEKNR